MSGLSSPVRPASDPTSSGRPRSSSLSSDLRYVALTGNPNCGKTTVFNALTGLRAKVGNYAGVTVERKEGRLQGEPKDSNVRVLDLPGTYSLSPQSLDEQISRDVPLNRLPELPAPSLIVVVVDASNLQRNLYYATQVIELGYPTLLALNMTDVAEKGGQRIDRRKLSVALGVPVVPLVASAGHGVADLQSEIGNMLRRKEESAPGRFCGLAPAFESEANALAELLAESPLSETHRTAAEALLILSNEKALSSSAKHYPQKVVVAVTAARRRLEAAGIDWRGAAIEARYLRVAEIQRGATVESDSPGETFSDRLDRVLTHKVWGTLIFLAIMMLIFQSIFTFAKVSQWTPCRPGWTGWGIFGNQADTARRSDEPAGGWCDRRSGCGDRISAADPPAVFVHRFSGRHRLHGPRRVSHGPADEQGGLARKKFHSDAQFVCLRHTGHHGNADD